MMMCGRVGHYIIKSVIDALSCGFLKLPHSDLPVKDNVGSECYGYAIIVSRSVLRGYSNILTHTFPDTCAILAWADTLLSSLVRAVVGLRNRTVEMEAHSFYYVVENSIISIA